MNGARILLVDFGVSWGLRAGLIGESETWPNLVWLGESGVNERAALRVLLLQSKRCLVVREALDDDWIGLGILRVDVDGELIVEERLRGVVLAVVRRSEQHGEADLRGAVERRHERSREEHWTGTPVRVLRGGLVVGVLRSDGCVGL